MSLPTFYRLLTIAFLFLFISSATVLAQTTAFTYQGRLNDTALPQGNGTYTMKFRLYDALTGGNQVGTEQTALVTVNNGTFTTTLDFSSPAFSDGQPRWLELQVEATTLSPRQPLTATPYAIRASTAQQADIAQDAQKLGGVAASEYVTNSTVGSSFIRNAPSPQQTGSFNISGNGVLGGNLGVGTQNATSKLDVRGNLTLDSGSSPIFYTGTGATEQNRYLQLINSPAFPSASGIKAGGILIADQYDFANPGKNDLIVKGSVGIGTTAPSPFYRLDVAGPVQSTGNSTHFVAQTTGGTNSWGRFYMRSANPNGSLHQSWFIGTSRDFNGNQFYLVDETGNQSRMTIQPFGGAISFPFGNVGVGTSTPATKLTIRDTANCCAATVRIESGGNTTISDVQFVTPGRSWAASGSSGTFAIVDQTAAISRIVVTDSGNIGIGIGNPARLLHVNGRTRISTIPAEASIGSLCYNGSGDILVCGASSLQLKTNITSFDDGLKIIRRLRPISFDWKDGSGHDIGFGAEDVAEIEPLLTIYNQKGEVEGVKYDRLNVVFVNAFKEQQQQIEEQKTTNQNLQTKVEQQQQEIYELKKIVCSLKSDAAVCKETKK